MAVSCIGYMVYIVCNFYPEFYTLIPAGVIAGCAAGTLWSAKAQYITVSALEYAKLTNRNKDAVIGIDENYSDQSYRDRVWVIWYDAYDMLHLALAMALES